MRVFWSPEGRLYGMTRQGRLWRAPLGLPWTSTSSLPYSAFWEQQEPPVQLTAWVRAATNSSGSWANHFGLSYLSPTLIEVGPCSRGFREGVGMPRMSS